MKKAGNRMLIASIGVIVGFVIVSVISAGQWLIVPISEWHWAAYPMFAAYWMGVAGAIMAAIADQEKQG